MDELVIRQFVLLANIMTKDKAKEETKHAYPAWVFLTNMPRNC